LPRCYCTGPESDRARGESGQQLFDIIDQDIQRNAAVLQVTYHPSLGYPTKIISDPIANAVDDEVTYTVSNLFEIPRPPGRFIP
jgi:hypothetical protein